MTCRPGVWTLIAAATILLASLLWWGSTARQRDAGSADPGDAYRDETATLTRAGRLEEALELVDRWTAAVPGDERAVLAAAELAARGEQPARAIELYTSIAASSADPARVWLRVADLEEAIGQLETAVESCRRAVSARPAWNDARLRLGDLLRIVGRLEEAAAVLEALLEESPSALAPRHALAAVRNGQGRFEDVVSLIGPFLEDPSLPGNAREHYAVALDELGRHGEAAAVWADLLAADPFHVEGYYRLGRLCRRLQRARLSRAMLARYEELASYRDRLESARKLELSGRTVAASIERAEAYAATQQVRLAVEHLRRAVASPRTDVDAALAAILSLVGFELLHEAREVIDALRSTPALPSPIADAMAGRVAERAADTSAASIAYERALAARPDYAPVLLALARIQLESDLDDSQLAATAALAARAHEAQADAESALLVGRVAFARGDLDAASERFEAAIRLAKRGRWHAEARVYLGRIRMARLDHDGAWRLLEETVVEAPAMADAWTALAEAHRGLGDEGRASGAAGKADELKRLEEEILEVRRALLRDAAARAPLFVRLAELAGRAGNRSRQVQYLATALYVDGKHAEAYRRLAAAYAEDSEVFLRIHALSQLVALEPGDADARRRLEEARASVGQTAEARPQ